MNFETGSMLETFDKLVRELKAAQGETRIITMYELQLVNDKLVSHKSHIEATAQDLRANASRKSAEYAQRLWDESAAICSDPTLSPSECDRRYNAFLDNATTPNAVFRQELVASGYYELRRQAAQIERRLKKFANLCK